MGLKDPVDVSKLEDPEYQHLKRGVFNLTMDDLTMIVPKLLFPMIVGTTLFIHIHYS